MTGRADHRDGYGYDPDATAILPIVPATPGPVTAPGVATGAELVDEGTGGSVARHGAVMAVGSLVSRATGFLRTAAIGAAIGASFVGNDYNLANTLPNMVYEFLLGGVLASVVVPLLVRARTRDADRGEAYTQRLLSLATIFLAVATIIAVAAAPLLTRLFVTDQTAPADRHLVTVLSYLLLPEIFFYGVAALLAAVLNTRGHFAAPMWTPILNNVVVILTAGGFALLPSLSSPPLAHTLSTAQVLVLGGGTTLGIVVQAIGLWPSLRKVGFRWRWRWDFRELYLRELARVSTWMLVYVIISQVGLVIMLNIANRAGDQGAPGPAIFNNAFLIFMMAHGIVAVSIITALMPRMSAAAAEHRFNDLAEQLSLGTRLSAVVLLPATAFYVVLGRQLGIALFQLGEYTSKEAVQTGWVIAAAGIGLVPFSISQLQIFAFYAMPDTKTPALLNLPVVALRIALDVLFFLVLPVLWVDAGLMGANTVSYLLATAIGYWLLRRRIGRLGLGQIFSTLGRLTVAAGLAAVPTLLTAWALTGAFGTSKLASIAQLIICGVVLIVGYVAVAFLLRVREVREVAGTIRGRLGR